MVKGSLSKQLSGPRVFVAMPYGRKKIPGLAAAIPAEGLALSDEVDFDDVWKALIRPALLEAGCRPYRADEDPSAGDIRTDMFFELVTGEFVLADISTLNANVFYELGVRHGVAPRGVLMIDGGWCRRPFDVAPDRTFSYDGTLFQQPDHDLKACAGRLAEQVELLARRLQGAVSTDCRTVSSPVYKELAGLRPVDWSGIRNAKARYFGCQLNEWHARVRKAKRQSHVGDILTLSRDSPNQMIEWQLRLDAARALHDLGSFQRARELLRHIVQEHPDNGAARYALAKSLDRLARMDLGSPRGRELQAQAEIEIEEALRRGGDGPEAHCLLGRIYKYRWRYRWEHEVHDSASRRALAVEHWEFAEKALRHYLEAQTLDLGLFHAGVNIVCLQGIRGVLDSSGGGRSVDLDLVGLVRTSARRALQQGQSVTASEEAVSNAVWASGTLGEVALVLGDLDAVQTFYLGAVNHPGVAVSQLKTFDDELALYEGLEFQAETVRSVRALLRERLNEHHSRCHGRMQLPNRESHSASVIAFRGEVFSGAEFEAKVEKQIAEQLDHWQISAGDVVICGARRGSEILFAEQCRARGASVRLLLPVKRSDYVAACVRLEGSDWERRFYALVEQCEVIEQHVRLGEPPAGIDPYDRNNYWCLDLARSEVHPGLKPRVVILLIDGQPDHALDSRGSLRHFMEHAQHLDLLVEEIVVRTAAATATVSLDVAAATAHIRRPGSTGEKIPFTGILKVGRAEGNDVVLEDGRISRHHLQLEARCKGLHLTNQSSHAGVTCLGDVPLEPKAVVWMTHGQTIKLIDGTTIDVETIS